MAKYGENGCGCGCGGNCGCGANCTCKNGSLDEALTNQCSYSITIATKGVVPSLEQIVTSVKMNLDKLKGWKYAEVERGKAEYCMHVFCASELPKDVYTTIAVFGYTVCKKDPNDGEWVELVSGLNHNPDEPYKLKAMIPGTPWPILAVAGDNKVIYFNFEKEKAE